MKKLNLLLLIMSIVFFTNCSQEQMVETETNSNLEYNLETPINVQLPNTNYDNSEKGLYHGVIASGINQRRGKIWLNISNNKHYSAYFEMVNGDKITYQLDSESLNFKSSIYNFISDKGSFTVNLNDYNQPVFSNITLDNEEFFAKVVKGKNSRMPFSFTGTFTDNGSFNGTWNLISTGVLAPIGFGYELIDSAVVTFNGNMYSASTFNTFNYPCFPGTPLNAQMGDLSGNPNAVISHSQTSNFSGTTSWDIGAGGGLYYNDACGVVSSGTFSWTNPGNGHVKNGFIYMD
jgi:hypothetical protein